MRRIIFVILLLSFNYTNAAIVEQLSSKVIDSQCTGALKNVVYYISGNSLNNYLIDEIWSPTDRYIALSTSKISFWESDNNLISGCRTSSDWYRQSEVAPGNNTKVVAFGANCVFNKPTNISKRTVQFVYNIKHGEITNNGTSTYTKHYSTYNYDTKVWNTYTKDYNNYQVENYEIHSNECLNIELRYCGDGIKDSIYGESCDPNDSSHTGWGTGGCDSECKPIDTPPTSSCNGLTVNPDSGTAPLTSTAVCSGTNVSTYSIDCGNGQIYNGTGNNSGTESFTNTCNYTSTGTYTPRCTINDTITNTACKDIVTVTDTPPTSSCNGLTVNPDSGTAPLTSTAVCSGTNVSTYSIDCGNGQIYNGTGNNSGTESFTHTCTYITAYTYTPRCTINDTITNTACTDSVNVTSSSSSSGGPSCISISASQHSTTSTGLTTDITCVGSSSVDTFKIDCGNGDIKLGGATPYLGRTNYADTCSYEALSGNETFRPRCYVSGMVTTDPNDVINTSNTCSTTITLGGPTYCGDGVIQRPNSNGQYEECEKYMNPDGTIGDFPSFCNSDCTMGGSSSSSSSSSSSGGGSGEITIPNEGVIIFGPVDSIIIGDDINPLEEVGVYPYIENRSSYDLYFDRLCVKKIGATIDGTNLVCKDINSILYPGEIESFDTYLNYLSNTNNISVNDDYGDNELITTIQNGTELFDWAYFAAHLDVRVSKPIVSTIGGGTSYISDTSKMANVSDVASGIENPDNNKNFIGVGVSTGSISSYSKDVDNNSSVEDIGREGDDYNDTITNLGTTNDNLSTVYSLTSSSLEKYNGLDNVFIFKGQNLEIDEIDSSLSGPRTYIVEDGDLIITGDLEYSSNIAFVTKGGNIIVKDDVIRIDGTYISIPKGGIGGKMLGSGIKTKNVLTINGNVYANMEDLVSERTYVKNDPTTGQINVGTIVSFASSIFRTPAPLVGQFIGEYMESEKIAY